MSVMDRFSVTREKVKEHDMDTTMHGIENLGAPSDSAGAGDEGVKPAGGSEGGKPGGGGGGFLERSNAMTQRLVTFFGAKLAISGLPRSFHRYLIIADSAPWLGERIVVS